jgi:hypothetical protein
MTGTKVCNKCGKKNLGWDYDFNKKTGKWKLENHKRMDGKWCNKPPENKVQKTTSADYAECELCLGNSGHCMSDDWCRRNPDHARATTLSEHKARHHPNGEVLDEIDFMILTDEQKAKTRLVWNQPKPEQPNSA